MTVPHATLMTFITTQTEAERFIDSLFETGNLWHFDDEPVDQISLITGRPSFTWMEAGFLAARRNECLNIPGWDPHGYCLKIIGMPS